MGTRFRFLAGVALPALLFCLTACSTSTTTGTGSGTGALFVADLGDSTVSNFSIDLTTGLLTVNGGTVPTGGAPSAMLLAPSGTELFVVNSGTNNISAYSVQTDGTLSAASGTTATGMTPLRMSMDSGGKFLFVANLGRQMDPTSGTVSVFAVQGTTLTEVTGSPFVVTGLSPASSPGPAGLAVTPDGKYLYVAGQFDSTLTEFSVNASGVLTEGPIVSVGTSPTAVTMTPDGGFLYVANSSSVSAFAICNQVVSNCTDPNSPDGSLTTVEGSPFSAGLAPVAMTVTPSGKFLFVVDRQSDQISEFKVATGTGVLTANAQPSISTGQNPVGITLRTGTTTNTTTGGVTTYLYVANLGASSISVYSFDSTVGTLGLVGGPVPVTSGQPSAVAAE
jgi:6-phosphogluconolactonase